MSQLFSSMDKFYIKPTAANNQPNIPGAQSTDTHRSRTIEGSHLHTASPPAVPPSYTYSEVLLKLPPLDPRSRHQDIRGQRVDNIGEWLFQTEEFRSWCAGKAGDESDNAVLFCCGDPGAGKTYIR